MEGYQATVENLGVVSNTLEKVFKTNKLPRFPVDYLRKAITIDWEDNRIVKVHYRDLVDSQVPKTNSYSLYSWMLIKEFVQQSTGYHISLQKTDVESTKMPYLLVVF